MRTSATVTATASMRNWLSKRARKTLGLERHRLVVGDPGGIMRRQPGCCQKKNENPLGQRGRLRHSSGGIRQNCRNSSRAERPQAFFELPLGIRLSSVLERGRPQKCL